MSIFVENCKNCFLFNKGTICCGKCSRNPDLKNPDFDDYFTPFPCEQCRFIPFASFPSGRVRHCIKGSETKDHCVFAGSLINGFEKKKLTFGEWHLEDTSPLVMLGPLGVLLENNEIRISEIADFLKNIKEKTWKAAQENK